MHEAAITFAMFSRPADNLMLSTTVLICGNVLATGMDPLYMTVKVRVKCAVCKTINVAVPDESVDPAAAREANRIKPR